MFMFCDYFWKVIFILNIKIKMMIILKLKCIVISLNRDDVCIISFFGFFGKEMYGDEFILL